MTSIGEAVTSTPDHRNVKGKERPSSISDGHRTEIRDPGNDELSFEEQDEDLMQRLLAEPTPSRVLCRSSRPRPRWRERRRARERARERKRERAIVDDDDTGMAAQAAGALRWFNPGMGAGVGALSVTRDRR
jgi:hypothetical protein